jgi:ribosomal protein S18 acetylase RimI-like enzyme
LDNLHRIDLPFVKPASLTCARSFADEPYMCYLIPDESKRVNLHYAFEIYLRMCIMGGDEVYATSPNYEGIALWVFSEKKRPFGLVLRAGNPFLSLRCGWQFVYRDFITNRFCEKIKKRYAPRRHLYLSLLAVDPAYQRKGYASLLMKPMLSRLDREHLPCYLETQNIKNVAMYQHFGFRLVYETVCPGTAYPLYAMLREP